MTEQTKDGYGTVERPVFRIYDMPSSVSFRLIEYAKRHAGNKAWVAIDQLLHQANLAHRLESVEKKLAIIEEKDKDGKI